MTKESIVREFMEQCYADPDLAASYVEVFLRSNCHDCGFPYVDSATEGCVVSLCGDNFIRCAECAKEYMRIY